MAVLQAELGPYLVRTKVMLHCRWGGNCLEVKLPRLELLLLGREVPGASLLAAVVTILTEAPLHKETDIELRFRPNVTGVD